MYETVRGEFYDVGKPIVLACLVPRSTILKLVREERQVQEKDVRHIGKNFAYSGQIALA